MEELAGFSLIATAFLIFWSFTYPSEAIDLAFTKTVESWVDRLAQAGLTSPVD